MSLFLVVLETLRTIRLGCSLVLMVIGAIRALWGDPWCLGEGGGGGWWVDFNTLRFPYERNREDKFSQVIDELELKDQPL